MSKRKWVCDASPVILLAKAGRADLLLRLPDELLIPKSVEQEVRDGPQKSPARSWLREHRSQYARRAISVGSDVASWELGEGESAALSWAVENPEWTVIVDDRAGRRCGEALEISLTGTLGLLLLAKEEEHISEVEPVIDALVDAGLQAGDALLETVLRQAGELG
jgi:predicted nucleic acid-binding protein